MGHSVPEYCSTDATFSSAEKSNVSDSEEASLVKYESSSPAAVSIVSAVSEANVHVDEQLVDWSVNTFCEIFKPRVSQFTLKNGIMFIDIKKGKTIRHGTVIYTM